MKKEARKNRQVQIFTAIVSIAITFISVGGYNYFQESKPEKAQVQQIDGLYIFIKSKPLNEYQSLGFHQMNSIDRAIESSQGNKKFKDFIKEVGKSLINDLDFDNRLKKVLFFVNQNIQNAEGIVFSDDLTEFESIRFQ